MMNECTVLIATESMILYTAILDPEGQNMVGWISVVSFVINMVLNIGIMLVATFQKLKLNIIKYYRISVYISDI